MPDVAELTKPITFGYVGDLIRKDKDQRLVYAIATGPKEDLDHQACDPEWLRKAVPAYMEQRGIGRGTIRFQHDSRRPVGKAIKAVETDDAEWAMAAKVVDDNAWSLVEEDVLTGLSIGVANAVIKQDPSFRNGLICGGNIVEVSLVDQPAYQYSDLTRDGTKFPTLLGKSAVEARDYVRDYPAKGVALVAVVNKDAIPATALTGVEAQHRPSVDAIRQAFRDLIGQEAAELEPDDVACLAGLWQQFEWWVCNEAMAGAGDGTDDGDDDIVTAYFAAMADATKGGKAIKDWAPALLEKVRNMTKKNVAADEVPQDAAAEKAVQTDEPVVETTQTKDAEPEVEKADFPGWGGNGAVIDAAFARDMLSVAQSEGDPRAALAQIRSMLATSGAGEAPNMAGSSDGGGVHEGITGLSEPANPVGLPIDASGVKALEADLTKTISDAISDAFKESFSVVFAPMLAKVAGADVSKAALHSTAAAVEAVAQETTALQASLAAMREDVDKAARHDDMTEVALLVKSAQAEIERIKKLPQPPKGGPGEIAGLVAVDKQFAANGGAAADPRPQGPEADRIRELMSRGHGHDRMAAEAQTSLSKMLGENEQARAIYSAIVQHG